MGSDEAIQGDSTDSGSSDQSPPAWLRRLGHELGNAVWAISGYQELIQRSLRRKQYDELPGDLDSVADASHRMRVLASHMRLASVPSGAPDEPGKSDLAGAFERVRHHLSHRFPAEVGRLPDEAPCLEVAVHPRLLEALLEELLANALEHAVGPLRLWVEDEEGTERAELVLVDGGPRGGEEAESRERWLEPGYSTAERLGLGTNLLATTLGHVGGRLELEPAPEGGSRWRLQLPPLADEAPDADEGRDGTDRTVLLVDDQAVIRTLIQRSLTPRGWRVRLATSGEEALAAIAEQEPDVLMLDLHMQPMSGYQVAGRLRAEGRSLPIVGFTASTEEEIAEEAGGADAHFDGFVEKTGELDCLDRELRSYLDGARRAQQAAALEAAVRQLGELSPEQRVERARRLLEDAAALAGRLGAAP